MTPYKPIKPDHSRNILLGIILGISIGVGFVVLFEYLDNSVKSATDIESKKLTVLGIIPSIGEEKMSVINFYFGKIIMLLIQPQPVEN